MRKIEDLNKMPPEKRKAEYASLRKKCPCPTCPTYTECAEERDERLFCIYGKSPDCVNREIRCICPSCSVHAEFGFKKVYYCTRGGESTAPRRF